MWSYTNTEQDWVEGRATAAHGATIGRQAAEILLALGGLFELWSGRMEGRHELNHLGTRDLRDIGLTRLDALCEADKPFWQA